MRITRVTFDDATTADVILPTLNERLTGGSTSQFELEYISASPIDPNALPEQPTAITIPQGRLPETIGLQQVSTNGTTTLYSNGAERVLLTSAATPGGVGAANQLEFARYGLFEVINNAGHHYSGGFYTAGQRSFTSDVAAAVGSSATYNGAFIGQVQKPGQPYAPQAIAGAVNVVADFDNQRATTRIHSLQYESAAGGTVAAPFDIYAVAPQMTFIPGVPGNLQRGYFAPSFDIVAPGTTNSLSPNGIGGLTAIEAEFQGPRGEELTGVVSGELIAVNPIIDNETRVELWGAFGAKR